jgi:hypothetical protein
MSATGFLDACGFTPASAGTGDFVVSAAIVGYQTPAGAGAVNSAVYSYRAESADKLQWEEGFGAYTVAGTTLARTTITASSTGAKVAFSAAPNVYITALSADLQNAALLTGGTLPAARIAFAVKADQVAATSTTLPVNPAVQQNHPSAAKAWVYFDGKTGGVATIKSSYGVSSVVRNSAGNYTVNWSTAFTSATAYAIQITASDPSVTIGLPFLTGAPLAAGSMTFQTRDAQTPVNSADMAIVMVCAFGGQ